ncbi:MAG: hypothetical protein HRU38_25400 [Saccharospirillaceae bacterium]|nr:hypothetical protein [Saccharospirillaceae bacterium]
MLTLEIFTQMAILFGGTSFVLIALSSFLANIWAKRIINGELAEHKRDLQNQVDDAKKELQREIIRHEAFTSISKEKYQELFEDRINLYKNLLLVKKGIDDSTLDNADILEVYYDDPRPFVEIIRKINSAARDNPMLMSNELAKLSNQLYDESASIFSKAKIEMFHVVQKFDSEQPELLIEVECSAHSELYTACGETYKNWLEQLEKDVSKIRASLDFTDVIWHAKY